jgi:hypothetical protein
MAEELEMEDVMEAAATLSGSATLTEDSSSAVEDDTESSTGRYDTGCGGIAGE